MKKTIFFLLSSILLMSCFEDKKYVITDNTIHCVIDSVSYHPMNSDNTLQVTPYWRVHLKELNTWMTSYSQLNMGDTVPVIIRQFKRTDDTSVNIK